MDIHVYYTILHGVSDGFPLHIVWGYEIHIDLLSRDHQGESHPIQPRKGNAIMYDLEERINASVFPGLQGGPHNQSITALAVALRQANSPELRPILSR